MLVDTRVPPPEPDRRRGEHPLVALLDWLFPWPALIAWLIAATFVVEGWLGVGAGWTALMVSFWRLTKVFPTVGGMRDHVP